VAGGGAGGISQFTGGGGGGGGQVVMLRNMPVTANSVKSVEIGAGGLAPEVLVAAQGAQGGTGGNSSFLNYTAAGGLGGQSQIYTTGVNIGGVGGGSYAASTITAGVGTVSTTLNAGSAVVSGNGNCSVGRNGSGGASSFAAGLQSGGTILTSSVGASAVTTNTINGYIYSDGGGGHRETGGATAAALGGTGTGGSGGFGATRPGAASMGSGGGGFGGNCGSTSIAVGGYAANGASGVLVIKYLMPLVPSAPTTTAWQNFNQLDWPAYTDSATTGYKVYWSTSASALSDSNIATLPSTNIVSITGATNMAYTHPSLTLGTSYYYRVAAVYSNASNVATTSPLSATVSATPQLTETVKYIQAGANDTPRVTNSFDVKDFVAPAGVTAIQVKAVGAGAGATSTTSWGNGGSVLTNLPVTPGETLKVYVGSQPQLVNGVNIPGWNGGGTSAYGLGLSLIHI
jgi:hypothetical protein